MKTLIVFVISSVACLYCSYVFAAIPEGARERDNLSHSSSCPIKQTVDQKEMVTRGSTADQEIQMQTFKWPMLSFDEKVRVLGFLAKKDIGIQVQFEPLQLNPIYISPQYLYHIETGVLSDQEI